MTDLLDRFPRGVAGALGLACAALGAVVLVRPFTSLSVLVWCVGLGLALDGVLTLADNAAIERRWITRTAGLGLLGTAVLVVAWPSITVQVLAFVVGIALVGRGAVEVVGAVMGRADERVAAVVGGVATMIFGALALAWPSVTLMVIAVVFGARLLLFGVRTAWASLRGRELTPAVSERSARQGWRRHAHLMATIATLLVAALLAGLSARLHSGRPVVDAFYTAPASVPDRHGALLRSEAFTRTIPDNARAWRILYTTTRADGVPAVASALVVVPTAPADGPRPVIALAHGTTGVNRTCAPSVLPDPFGAGAFFALDEVIDRGWALVATDYVGLGTVGPHPYLIGEPSARSVLDSVLAARELNDADLGDQTVVWGHSQGGGAALWTGGLAPTYAPEADVIGVAALAPASDLVGLMDTVPTVTGGSIFATYALDAYAAVYDDVRIDDYVRPTARPSFDAVAARCLAEPSVLLSAIGSLAFKMTGFRDDLTRGAFRTRLEENIPTAHIDAPLLIAQGDADSLIAPAVQRDYVTGRCADGQPLDFRTYPGRDHIDLVEADSPLMPELFEWTADRFDGAAATSTCPSG